ncbi:hypothetical protein F6453_3388 [Marinobacter nauticus]|uniref:Uncharacterized protein n=1 Tax=Marinobacter nauticus TaxID=2743 RepID=A0A833N9C9_MARNT|nr:hypothetical protein F6453_3388 [Marinobacter nauticus]
MLRATLPSILTIPADQSKARKGIHFHCRKVRNVMPNVRM